MVSMAILILFMSQSINVSLKSKLVCQSPLIILTNFWIRANANLNSEQVIRKGFSLSENSVNVLVLCPAVCVFDRIYSIIIVSDRYKCMYLFKSILLILFHIRNPR